MGFQEIDHFSDRAVLVTAPNVEELFQQAAQAMYTIMDVDCSDEAFRRTFSLEAIDTESLLVSFLSELLSVAELENLAAQSVKFAFSNLHLAVEVVLSPILKKVENIKAVTYADMNIKQTDEGYETVIVFDL